MTSTISMSPQWTDLERLEAIGILARNWAQKAALPESISLAHTALPMERIYFLATMPEEFLESKRAYILEGIGQ